MGWSVGYENGRWVGYGVPAECDWPDCHEEINRGMAYRCEEHIAYELNSDPDADDPEEEIEIDREGCNLFFCGKHLYDTDQHDDFDPKPDVAEWRHHMLTDASWAKWRETHPEALAALA